jgi:hypothetical protein
MPASVIRYRRLVSLTLANNAINLAQSTALGHRVKVNMSTTEMNKWFRWARDASDASPIGGFIDTPADGSSFKEALKATFGAPGFTDSDAVNGGLSFSSNDLGKDAGASPDFRLKSNGDGVNTPSVNDWVVAYVLYKVYGKSSYDTTEDPTTGLGVYNVEDMYSMLSNEEVAAAILASLLKETPVGTTNQAVFDAAGTAIIDDVSGVMSDPAGAYTGELAAINQMFRAHLSANPMRFFDASGRQIQGLFETAADSDASGNWALQVEDQIEIPLELTFSNIVTSVSSQDPLSNSRNNNDASGNSATTTAVESGHKFRIRLQLTCVA